MIAGWTQMRSAKTAICYNSDCMSWRRSSGSGGLGNANKS